MNVSPVDLTLETHHASLHLLGENLTGMDDIHQAPSVTKYSQLLMNAGIKVEN